MNQINEVVYAEEVDPTSPGSELAAQHGLDKAPFFVVRDDRGEQINTSVMRLITERLG